MPHVQVFLKEEIPKELNYAKSRRIAPIIVIADEGYTVNNYKQQALAGNHGFNNSLENMRAIFMGNFPAIFSPTFKLSTWFTFVCSF